MWCCESSRFRSLQSKPSFWHQRNNINKPQYINFFLAAVTNYHKIGGLKQYRFIFLYCWRSEVPNGSHLGKIKVLAELTFLCGGQVGGGGRGGGEGIHTLEFLSCKSTCSPACGFRRAASGSDPSSASPFLCEGHGAQLECPE